MQLKEIKNILGKHELIAAGLKVRVVERGELVGERVEVADVLVDLDLDVDVLSSAAAIRDGGQVFNERNGKKHLHVLDRVQAHTIEQLEFDVHARRADEDEAARGHTRRDLLHHG